MRKRSEFFNEIDKIVRGTISEIQEEEKKIKKLKQDEKAGDYSQNYLVKNIYPGIDSGKRIIEDKKRTAKEKIRKICEEYKKEINLDDCLKPEELTDDIKLINAGVKFTQKEIQALLDRNKGNLTMSKIILRTAREQGIKDVDFRDPIPDYSSLLMNVSGIPNAAEVVFKHADNEAVYNRLFGNDSPIRNDVFMDETPAELV